MVQPEDLESLLRSHGWTPKWTPSHKQRIAYAQRRVGKQVTTRYIATESKLREMTEDSILEKLNRSSKTQQAS